MECKNNQERPNLNQNHQTGHKNQKNGQALIETLVGIPIFFILLLGLGLVVYLALIKVHTGFLLHEYLLCRESTHRTHGDCHTELRNKISKILPFGSIRSIDPHRGRTRSVVKVRIAPLSLRFPLDGSLNPLYRLTVQEIRSISLPLDPGVPPSITHPNNSEHSDHPISSFFHGVTNSIREFFGGMQW